RGPRRGRAGSDEAPPGSARAGAPMKPPFWDEAARELSRRDRTLRRLVRAHPATRLRRRADPFTTLARAIVGQQISVKAADAIWWRFVAVADDAPAHKFRRLPAEKVAAADMTGLRNCGLSQRKAEYLSDLARHFASGQLDPKRWRKLDD